MSNAATFELQQKFYAAITGDAGVKVLMGATPAIYDSVPDAVRQAYQKGSGPTYVTIGEGNEAFDLGDFDGTDGFEQIEHKCHIYVWSQQVGAVEAKKITYAIKEALIAALPEGSDLGTNTLNVFHPLQVMTERAPDGVTTRAMLVMRALTTPHD
jgi:hypothetical protein